VSMSCKSSLCLRCAKVYVDTWVSQVSKVLHEGVIYRTHHPDGAGHVPHDLLPQRRGLVERIDAMRVQCMDDFFSEVRGKALRGATSW